MNTGGASSVGGENIRPSRDVRFLLIPESPALAVGSMSNWAVQATTVTLEGNKAYKETHI